MSNRSPNANYSVPAAAELMRHRRAEVGAALETLAATDPAAARSLMQSVNLPQFYGDATVLPIVFAAAGDQIALPRPRGVRTMLLIVNILPGNPINYSWDRAADAVTGIPIGAANGFRLFDNSVPQNDLHIFSPVAGTVLVEYMNIGDPVGG